MRNPMNNYTFKGRWYITLAWIVSILTSMWGLWYAAHIFTGG